MKGARAHTADRPAWIIHTSGTGILGFEDTRARTVGVEREKIWDDWDNVYELTITMPDDALHRDVDKIILGAGEASPAVKTAIVAPPSINGTGRGAGHIVSQQIPTFAREVLKRKKGIVLGEGRSIWNWVHIHDLSEVYLALGEAAAAGGGNATWGKEGYYFAESGPFYWGDVQREVSKVAYEKGYIPTAEIDTLSYDEAAKVTPDYNLPFGCGSNSRSKSIRARKLFGWAPTRPQQLLDLIPEIVETEARALGLRVVGHKGLDHCS